MFRGCRPMLAIDEFDNNLSQTNAPFRNRLKRHSSAGVVSFSGLILRKQLHQQHVRGRLRDSVRLRAYVR